jgi:hypothetical protein
MRGDERIEDGMFSYDPLDQRVPRDHPLWAVRKLTDAVLRRLSLEFDDCMRTRGVHRCAGVHSAGAVIAGVLLGAL